MAESYAERVCEALERTRKIADALIAPRATESDRADSPPVGNIRTLAEAGLMGMSTPERYGGIGAPSKALREFTEILASSCGVTCFVQGQNQSAALLVAGGENQSLKDWLLPKFATGEVMGGVAFSHLRRPGPPAMRATPDGEGFILNGFAPWITGWPLLQELVLGGTLPDGRLVYVVAPMSQLTPSPPMRLCAMNASGTISATCKNLRIGPERWLKTITKEQMAVNDVKAILAPLPQPLGVTVAAIRHLHHLNESRANMSVDLVIQSLEDELRMLRLGAELWYDRTEDPRFKQNALEIRARAIEMGVRAAHAAVAASAGSANSLDHPAQRLFREAMFYTLTAQTPDVRAATLSLLASRSVDSDL